MSKQEIHVCDACGRRVGPGLDDPTVEGWAKIEIERGAPLSSLGPGGPAYFTSSRGVEKHVCSASCLSTVLRRLSDEPLGLAASRSPKAVNTSNVIPLEGGSYRTPPRGA